jgi:F-box interacting protein
MKFTQLGSYNPKSFNYNIVGSCNGILCLANSNEGFVMLWNPSIRKFKELPYFQKPQYLYFDGITYGFGHDRISDKYKVVAVLHYVICDNGGNFIHKSEVKVHVLGTNFWKNIREFPCGCFPSEDKGYFVSGAINWLASKNTGTSSIVSFNLEKESYQEILQPDHKNIDDSSCHLGVLRDCLCMIYGDDVWVMREYGNKDSWTKLFTIPHIQNPRTSYRFLKIVNIFEDDQVLLEYVDESIEENWTWKLMVYDSKNDIIKSMEIGEYESTPEVCVESLISPYF